MCRSESNISNKRNKPVLGNYENPTGHTILLNWGNCLIAEISKRSTDTPYHCAENAEVCDQVIRKVCNERDILSLQAHYVLQENMEMSAELLSELGYPCSRKQFSIFLEQARAKVEGSYLGMYHDCDRIFDQLKLEQEQYDKAS